MESFQYVSYAQEVIFGPGSLARLSERVEHYGLQRLMLCTNRSMRANGCAALVETALGERLAAVFEPVEPHVMDVQVAVAVASAEEKQVDGIVGLGGGSPIGMAKAASFTLEKQRMARSTRTCTPTDQPLVPVIAIPTTYAGSEMTAVCGITHTRENPPQKVTLSDPRIAPKLVIYDPELTTDLPPEMTASTGINALAHCIEALYSITRNPLSTAAAVSGVRHIFHALPICFAQGGNLDARSEMLLGAHLAGLSLAGVKMALHHGLCHVLGGTAKIPHGIANSIMLPHVLRFNAQATAPLLFPAVEAMGVAVNERAAAPGKAAVEAAAQRIYELAGAMNLPRRLRDAGVKESDLPRLAQLGFENRTVHNNPRPIESVAQIESILRAAW